MLDGYSALYFCSHYTTNPNRNQWLIQKLGDNRKVSRVHSPGRPVLPAPDGAIRHLVQLGSLGSLGSYKTRTIRKYTTITISANLTGISNPTQSILFLSNSWSPTCCLSRPRAKNIWRSSAIYSELQVRSFPGARCDPAQS